MTKTGTELTATIKQSNPKDALGIRKIAMSVMPIRVLYSAALKMLEGALKYGRHNYRTIGVRASVYYDAAKRHMDDWYEGQDIDTDTKIQNCHNLDGAIASLIVIRDAIYQGNLTDDRPPKAAPGWLADMNRQAAALVDAYPEPKQPFTQKDHPASYGSPSAPA